MIKEIELINFGPHKHLKIETKALFAIKGGNNAGKSHVIEACKILLMGEDFPINLIRTGADSATIKCTFADNRSITRERSKTINKTILKDTSEITYTTTTGLKDIIKEFSQVKEVDLDGNETFENFNIIDVDNDSFLVQGKSPEMVMRSLSNLTAGHGFELGKKKAHDDLKGLNKEISVVEHDVTSMRIKLETAASIIDLDELDETYERFKALKSSVASAKVNLGNVRAYKEFSVTQTHTDAINKVLSTIDDTLATLDELAKAKEQLTQLGKLQIEPTEDIAELDNEISSLVNKLNPIVCKKCKETCIKI